MSIAAPRYAAASTERLSETYRTLSIWRQEFLRRAGWGAGLVVALSYIAVTIFVVFDVEVASATGLLAVSSYDAPFQSPLWGLLMLIVATAVGAGSVADDVGSRAIVLYLSRPIHLLDYLSAKAASVGSWMVIAAVGPGLVGVGILAALGVGSATTNLEAAAGFLVTGLVASFFFTGLAIALSTLMSRAIYAGVAMFGIVLALDISTDVVAGITGNLNVYYLSPITDLTNLAAGAFHVPGPFTTDPTTSGLLLVAVGVLLAVVAYWRLSRVEVVGE
jgi:ABC-type transport system involved in multi-copper enzyme maturation permease subunit